MDRVTAPSGVTDGVVASGVPGWGPGSLIDDPQALSELVAGCRRLLVFHAVLASPAGQLALELLGQTPGSAEAAQTYARLFRVLAAEVELREYAAAGDAWQQHLTTRLLSDDNVFSAKARRHGVEAVGSSLREAVAADLRVLGELYRAGGRLLHQLGVAVPAAPAPALDGLQPLVSQPAEDLPLRQLLHTSDDWSAPVAELARHYAHRGTGLFAGQHAFRWLGSDERPPLRGVLHPDPVRLADLIGDRRQRDLIRRNTEHFLAGLPANNVLLYGDRGTGKSSTVKALLNEYGDRGLRLLEVARGRLGDFPAIVELLSDQPERFILFVDDLSFDEHETSYKDLKAVLEGGLEVRPDNVLVYATSNRRHLVKERQSDRAQPGDDELHGFDTVQEKLSLADRFGITLTFVAPNQEQYLEIVGGLAARRGLALPEEELRSQALQWAAWHNGRSGRGARQFIDYLAGELANHGAS